MDIKKFFILIIILSIFNSCEERTDLTEPNPPETGEADFSRFLSIGNSLTAGFQNGALYESAQKYSYAKLIAGQAETEFVQPTVSDPGIGGRLEAVSFDPPIFSTRDILAGLPNNSEYDSIYNNLAVPGAYLEDILYASDASSARESANLFFNVVLRGRGTVLEQLKSFNPTLITLWIGNNDILGFATSGGTGEYTSHDTFALLFDELGQALADEQVPVFIGNIPNVNTIPYFTTVSPLAADKLEELQNDDTSLMKFVFEMNENSRGRANINDLNSNEILMTLGGASAIDYIGDRNGSYYQSIGISAPDGVDLTYPFGLSDENPFPNRFIVDKDEQNTIENAVSSYNSIIDGITLKYGFYLVDMNLLFNTISEEGLIVDGVHFTTDFISGGLFSLDGIHPTSQGHAVIANKFLEAINEKLSASIPMINVSVIPGSLEISKLTKFNSSVIPQYPKNTFEYPFY